MRIKYTAIFIHYFFIYFYLFIFNYFYLLIIKSQI